MGAAGPNTGAGVAANVRSLTPRPPWGAIVRTRGCDCPDKTGYRDESVRVHPPRRSQSWRFLLAASESARRHLAASESARRQCGPCPLPSFVVRRFGRRRLWTLARTLALPTLRCIPVPTPNVRRARFPTPHVCCVRNSALRPCAVCSSAVPTCLSCRSFAVRTSAWCPNPRIKIYKSSPRTRARDLGLCTPTHRPLCYGAVERAQNAHASLLTFVLPLGRLVLPLGLCRMPGNRRLDSAGCRGSTFVRGVLLDRTFSAVATFVRFVGTFGKSPPLSACARARCRIFLYKSFKMIQK